MKSDFDTESAWNPHPIPGPNSLPEHTLKGWQQRNVSIQVKTIIQHRQAHLPAQTIDTWFPAWESTP